VSSRTEVATYVIETVDRRYRFQPMVAIGSDEFAAMVTVGSPVTFAVEKKTAYRGSVPVCDRGASVSIRGEKGRSAGV
jgi:hypothetical protein